MSEPALLGAAIFVLLAPAGTMLIRWLQARGLAKRIRADGPATHQAKAGTPTMGGLLFVGGALIAGVGLLAFGHTQPLWPMLSLAAYAALGCYDDLRGLKDQQGIGWLARAKFPCQWGIAVILALGMYLGGAARPFWLPFGMPALDLGIWFVPVAAFVMVGFVNAANLTDGLDGLAAGTGAFVVVCLAVVGAQDDAGGLTYWCMSLAGGLLAFLWHNAHPARVFMGDVGAEALGAALAAVALVSGHALLLLVSGIAMVSEAVSDIVQVGYFKYTRRRYGEGRRVFRMAPLHHHFEALGMDEVQVTTRFWIATAVASFLAVAVRGVH